MFRYCLRRREATRAESPIHQYQARFADQCGAKHAVSFGAGRMALYAILSALDIGDNDEVIVPAFTCVVVPNAILYAGAKPVYVDIEATTFNIDVTKVECAITARTKALYAQHTFGTPCDIEALREIARRHDLPIIEDGAHALGATYHGRRVGSLTEVAFFSTDHSKVVNTHLGGMAVTNSETIAERLRSVQGAAHEPNASHERRLVMWFLLEYLLYLPHVLWFGRTIHAIVTKCGGFGYFRDELCLVKPREFPARLTQAQALLGLSQLADLARNLQHRRAVASLLEERIKWHRGAVQADSAWLRYAFLVRDQSKFEKSFGRHFDLGIWFTTVLGGRSSGFESVGYVVGSCPIAEYVSAHIVNFPTHLRIPISIVAKEIHRNWRSLSMEIVRP